MTDFSLENPEFVNQIRSPECLPWGQVLFSAGADDYLYSNGWVSPLSAEQRRATLDWSSENRMADLSVLAGMTWIPGPEQWFESKETHELNLAARMRNWGHARLIFGSDFKPGPADDPWFNSTVIGACRNKNTDESCLAVIQFSPPPPFIREIHRIGDFEFLPSPFAVTLEEFRRQKNLAYEVAMGSEVVNLDAGDGRSYSRIGAPFYTWPREGPMPMLTREEACNRPLVHPEFEFQEVILFFAWFG